MDDNQDLKLVLSKMTAMLGGFSLVMKDIQLESQKQSEDIQSKLMHTQNSMKNLVDEAQASIRQETKKSIDDALITQTIEFEKRLKLALNEVETSIHTLHAERKALASQIKILTWKGIIGIAVGMSIMVIASVVMTMNEKEKRDAIYDEYQSLQIKAQSINAEDKMIKTQCGDKLCIKIDPASKWGENGEYAIPILE